MGDARAHDTRADDRSANNRFDGGGSVPGEVAPFLCLFLHEENSDQVAAFVGLRQFENGVTFEPE